MPVECVIGVDVGGTKILAGAVDRGLGVHRRVRRPTPRKGLIDELVAVVEELREGVEVAGVGVGVPALVDRAGIASSSVHVPALDGLAVADVLAERLDLPVAADNDVNAAMLAEHRAGAARDATEALMLTVGTGIGGAIVSDGRLLRGAHGAAGELGHVPVWADGPACGPGCPARGCLEALASGSALEREATALAAARPGSALAALGVPGGPAITELAHDGDPDARGLLAAAGRWLGIGIAGLANAFDPEVVVVGGGMIAAGELLLGPAREALEQRVLPMAGRSVQLRAAHFGAESGMLGAAMAALDMDTARR